MNKVSYWRIHFGPKWDVEMNMYSRLIFKSKEKTRQNYADLLQQVRRLFDTMASTS
jgi:hypothetical protein